MFAAVKSRFFDFYSTLKDDALVSKPVETRKRKQHFDFAVPVASTSPIVKKRRSKKAKSAMNRSSWSLSSLFQYVTQGSKPSSTNQQNRIDNDLPPNQAILPIRHAVLFTNDANRTVLDSNILDDEEIEIVERHVQSSEVIDSAYSKQKPIGFLKRSSMYNTLNNTVRLKEKQRYKEILEKVTSPIYFPDNDTTPEIINISDEWSFEKRTPVRIDLTKQKETAINTNLRRKFYHEILEESQSCLPLNSFSTTSYGKCIPETSKDFNEDPLDLTWIQKWKDVLDPVELERERRIKEEERKIALIKDKRKKEYESLQNKLEKSKYPQLTENMLSLVKKILSYGNPQDVICQGFNSEITRSDLCTLRDATWLNDEVVNFYFNLLKERSEQNGNLPKILVFNTFFYPKIQKTGFAGVKRWTRKIDVFMYDMILIPVHLGMHWCMAEINLKDKTIVYYDSLKGNNANCLTLLKNYLEEESLDKKKRAFDFDGWTELMPKNIPEQMNGCDCGVFACKYAEYRSREADFTFTQNQMPYFRKQMIYEIATKRLL